MNEPDHLADYGAALAAYVSALDIICECVSEVCPEVGKLSSQRIGKLRDRLSFQPSREAIRESTATLRRELIKHYAVNAAMQVERQEIEFERGMAAVQHLVDSVGRLNEASAAQLRQLVTELEALEVRTDGNVRADGDARAHGEPGKTALARQAAKIRQCGESLVQETAQLSRELREEVAAIEARLLGPHAVDPVTGLLTRAEVLRRIRLLSADDITHHLLLFEVDGPISNAVLRQVGTKLGSQFRHHDLVARWAEREFLVVFQGAAQFAEARMPHIAGRVSGRYHDDNDMAIDIAVTARMEQPDLVGA